MRLIVHGQQAFGQSVLEKLIERGEDIVGVYVAPDKGKPDPLKVAAEEAGLPVFQPTTYKEPEVWDQMKSLSPDLCVMAFVTLFVPEEALYLPTHDSIQYHPSLLLHRGPSAINWPIIMGRKETGLSIFWPDNGLDEGPILLQKTCTIEENDTLGTVYFDKLFPMGVDAMMESVDLVKQGNAPRIDQDHSQKTYESWCRKADVELDFAKPMQEVHNMIRGADPVPGAWTTCGGAEIPALRLDQGGKCRRRAPARSSISPATAWSSPAATAASMSPVCGGRKVRSRPATSQRAPSFPPAPNWARPTSSFRLRSA